MVVKRILATGVMALLIVGAGLTSGALASLLVRQTALAPTAVAKYEMALPTFVGARVPATSPLSVIYQEWQQKVLPDSFYLTLAGADPINPYPGIYFSASGGTQVWAYNVGGAGPSYPGVTVEAQKGTATAVTYINNLGTANTPPLLQRYITIDQTLKWANPMGLQATDYEKWSPYSGPHPVVPHLHGGEVRSDSDGGPDEWWTPGGEGILSTPPAAGGIRGPGYYKNIYNYPNAQEAGTIWFHDHALGATRTNVYAGIAAFWLIRDQFDTGLVSTGLNLPAGPQEIEIAIQDRQFDTNGQWLFPDGYPAGLNGPPMNPDVHPYWNGEFFGDFIVVNGKTWPFLNVEPRRYRFRLLNGSNARVYDIRLDDTTTPVIPPVFPPVYPAGPPIYVIGTDGGLLDTPAITSSTDLNRLIIAPGERYDVIIDFTNFASKTLTIMNFANGPFPGGGITPDPNGTMELMQFRVAATSPPDNSYNPASGTPLREANVTTKPPPIVRLADGNGAIAPGVVVNKTRQLVLREIMSPAGAPLEILMNNTKFDGLRDGTQTPIPGSSRVGPNWMTELPQIGSTEVWEIINPTADAHPIHPHMIQFQLVNRQAFNQAAYDIAYATAFGGTVIDGYGPPNIYNTPNPIDGAIGGNPSVTPHLNGPIQPPLPQEYGWKDTILAYPGEVTRIIGRWAPQDVALNAVNPGQNLFSFDPTYGPGYVWHCHIIDHEDNEMMRPYIPSKKADNTFAKFGEEIPGIVVPLLLLP